MFVCKRVHTKLPNHYSSRQCHVHDFGLLKLIVISASVEACGKQYMCVIYRMMVPEVFAEY